MNKPERFKACLSGVGGARLLEILRSLAAIRPTKGAKVHLQVVVTGHHMCGMDLSRAKHVVAVTAI